MSSPLEPLEPRLVWSHFDDIRQIPRPSKHEEKIAEHVRAWANDHGREILTDATGNMVVKVPATPGHESAPTVVLQGHLDMVCEKNSDVEMDFMTDPIQVEVDGDWVKAVGTTLGADNGIGLATAMALADDPDAVHGPLEILATVDEETGLTGAMQLDPSIISGRLMVNLDSEEDGAAYIGCAGGADSEAHFSLPRRTGLIGSQAARLSVRGLRGGHSGLDIIDNRCNAIKLAVRILREALDEGLELDLVSLAGGSKHNAIPREAFGTVRLPKASIDALRNICVRLLEAFREEFGAIDPDITIEVEELEDADDNLRPMNVHARDRLLHAINGLPHGVLSMSREVPGLVETSNNVAVLKMEGDIASLRTSHRSSVMPSLFAVQQQVRSICSIAGAEVEVHDSYPGWKPNPESPLIKKTAAVYEEIFGKPMELKAIHAGLECGLLLEKIKDMDIVSVGPEIKNPHSPDERVQISSVARFYTHLKGLLKTLA